MRKLLLILLVMFSLPVFAQFHVGVKAGANVTKVEGKSFKDEFVLIVVCIPILVLAWSLFSGDPKSREKLELFFELFNKFPEFYKWLVVGIFGAIYGLKPTLDVFKK